MLNNIKIDRKFWINLVFFVAGGLLLVYFYAKYRMAPDLAFEKLPLKTPEGQIAGLADFKGKVIVLNFWETWCGPCVQEMPTLEKARQLTDSTQVAFITVAEEDAAKIAAFRDAHDYRFHYFISGKTFHDLGINAYPTTYILNKKGEIVLTKIGGEDWSDESNIAFIKELCRK